MERLLRTTIVKDGDSHGEKQMCFYCNFPGLIGDSIVSMPCTLTFGDANTSPFLEMALLTRQCTKLHTSSTCSKVGATLHARVFSALQKQVSYFNHGVVTPVADKLERVITRGLHALVLQFILQP